jgi:hypothetical protein
MHSFDHNTIRVETTPTETLLPEGLFDERSPGSAKALNALRTIEMLIKETNAENAVLARYAWLQSFPRLTHDDSRNSVGDGFVSRFGQALCPSTFRELLDSLSDDETEAFLKNYLVAHETWGHPEGLGSLVKTMLESYVHQNVPVEVLQLKGEERAIPEPLQSLLGSRMSRLGKDLVLGRHAICRPARYEIIIGPISHSTLRTIQLAGWANETHATPKLQRLTDFAEAFYHRAMIRFVLESSGLSLGVAVLGSSRLGDTPIL